MNARRAMSELPHGPAPSLPTGQAPAAQVGTMPVYPPLSNPTSPSEGHGHPHLGGSYLDAPDANTWVPDVWEHVIHTYGIRSFLDIGCGAGWALRWAIDRGCEPVQGVEGDPEALRAAANRTCVRPNSLVCHDFTTGPYVPERVYDLGWC